MEAVLLIGIVVLGPLLLLLAIARRLRLIHRELIAFRKDLEARRGT